MALMSRKVPTTSAGSPRLWIRIVPSCVTMKSRFLSPGGDVTNSGRPFNPIATGTDTSDVLAAGAAEHAPWARARPVATSRVAAAAAARAAADSRRAERFLGDRV